MKVSLGARRRPARPQVAGHSVGFCPTYEPKPRNAESRHAPRHGVEKRARHRHVCPLRRDALFVDAGRGARGMSRFSQPFTGDRSVETTRAVHPGKPMRGKRETSERLEQTLQKRRWNSGAMQRKRCNDVGDSCTQHSPYVIVFTMLYQQSKCGQLLCTKHLGREAATVMYSVE